MSYSAWLAATVRKELTVRAGQPSASWPRDVGVTGGGEAALGGVADDSADPSDPASGGLEPGEAHQPDPVPLAWQVRNARFRSRAHDLRPAQHPVTGVQAFGDGWVFFYGSKRHPEAGKSATCSQAMHRFSWTGIPAELTRPVPSGQSRTTSVSTQSGNSATPHRCLPLSRTMPPTCRGEPGQVPGAAFAAGINRSFTAAESIVHTRQDWWSRPRWRSTRATRCPDLVRPHRGRPRADRVQRAVQPEPAGPHPHPAEGRG
jgi:hypothetical protein